MFLFVQQEYQIQLDVIFSLKNSHQYLQLFYTRNADRTENYSKTSLCICVPYRQFAHLVYIRKMKLLLEKVLYNILIVYKLVEFLFQGSIFLLRSN